MPALLERDRAMSDLQDALSRAGDGNGAVVVLEGPAGIGKSALLRAFLDDTTALALVGVCDDLNIPQTLGAFEDMAREHSDLEAAFDAGLSQFRRTLLERLDRASPTVIAIEDLHWCDQATADLLLYLSRRIHDLPVLLICTQRTGLPIDHPVTRLLGQVPAGLITRIELTELSLEAVERLAEGSDRDPATLYDLTDGNPFLVTEILATENAVPPTISDSVSARIGRLPPPAGEVASLLSVIPGEAEWELIEALLPDGSTALADLELEGVVVSSKNGIAYRHELLRRAVEARLTPAKHRSLNRQVLHALIDEAAPSSRIAHHAHETGDVAVLLDHSRVAIEVAAEAGAHIQALEHIRSVIPHVERLPLREQAEMWQRASREHWFNGESGPALEAARRAVALWERVGDQKRFGVALSAAATHAWKLRPEEGARLRRRAISVLESIPPSPELVEAYVVHGQDLGLSSRLGEALTWLDRAVTLANEMDDEVVAAKAMGAREVFRMATGDIVGSRSDGARATEILSRENEQAVLAITHGNRVAVAVNALVLDHVDEDVAAARAYAEEIESAQLETMVAAHGARLELLRGNWEVAAELSDLALERTRAGISRTTTLMVRSLLSGRRGDPSAVESLDEAVELASRGDDIQRMGSVGAAVAEMIWLGLSDRWVFLRDAFRLSERSGYLRFHSELAIWLRRLGEDAPHQGDAPQPHAMELAGDYRGAARSWRDLEAPYQEALSLAFSGDPELMRSAIDIVEGLGATATRDRIHQMMREQGIKLGRRKTAATRANPSGLTPRQMEVLQLLALDLTNAGIAERLFISPKTVDHHVSAILTKLGVSTRSDAAALLPDLLGDQ